MGLFSFVQSAGQALGIISSKDDEAAKAAAEKAAKAEAAAKAAQDQAARDRAFADGLAARVEALGIDVTIDAIAFHEGIVTVRGTAGTNTDREKAILMLGNVSGVSQVHEGFEVTDPGPESTLHTVVKGDLLSKIADQHYGDKMLYNLIFEANRPMLDHPDRIYPEQVLRVPAPGSYVPYTVVRGDTLGRIAKHFYNDASRWTAIQSYNSLPSDAIDVGQELRVPVPGAANA